MEKEKFTIRLADQSIAVSCIYRSTLDFCAGYLTDAAPDFCIEISDEDIANEIAKSDDQNFSKNYYETLVLYRKIATELANYDTILFHGSAISIEDSAFIFTGKSGTGKSTHARLWRQLLQEKAQMVNDDKPLIKVKNGKIFVYGTPWDGKHRLSENISVPLKAICLLEQAPENKIEEISPVNILPTLLQQTFRPEDSGSLKKILDILTKILEKCKFYKMQCNMDIEAAQIAYNTMGK